MDQAAESEEGRGRCGSQGGSPPLAGCRGPSGGAAELPEAEAEAGV